MDSINSSSLYYKELQHLTRSKVAQQKQEDATSSTEQEEGADGDYVDPDKDEVSYVTIGMPSNLNASCK